MKSAVARIALAAVVTFVAFVVAEFLVEGLAWLLFRVSETEVLSRTYDVTLAGLRYHSMNFVTLFATCIVLMSAYALIRTNLQSLGKAVVVTSAIALLLMFIPGASLANTGLLTVEVLLTSFVFNLFELPVAILFGAGAYELGGLSRGRW